MYYRFVTALLTALPVGACAQHAPLGHQPPAVVEISLRHRFPDARGVSWYRESGRRGYAAWFTSDQGPRVVHFSEVGAVLDTQQLVAAKALPPLARTELAWTYADWQIARIVRVEAPRTRTVWYVADLRQPGQPPRRVRFDQQGRVLLPAR